MDTWEDTPGRYTQRILRIGWLLGVYLLGLFSCSLVPPPAPPPELDGWQVIYRRPAWQAGSVIDLRALGDVSLARGVAMTATQRGPETLLAELAPWLAGDLALANLETSLSDDPVPVRPGPYRLIANPALAVALQAGELDLLGLSNNHSLDAGAAGLVTTHKTLEQLGLATVGVGTNEAGALTPFTRTVNGLGLAVLAFNDVLDPADQASLARLGDQMWANPDFAACAATNAPCPIGRAWLSETALEAVRDARQKADVLVVLVHWGREYSPTPSPRQQAWATRLIAAGADLVLGSHPHRVQPIALINAGGRQGFVAYSLGNALFDGPADLSLSSGVILRAVLDHDGVALIAAAPLATAGAHPQVLALDSPAAQVMLAALDQAGSEPFPSTYPTLPSTTTAPSEPNPGTAQPTAWRWNGTSASHISPPDTLAPPGPMTRLAADLRGDGEPLWATLSPAGIVTLRDGPEPDAPIVWQNEDPAWRFTAMAVGDPNDDGRIELALLLWQADEQGNLRSQPYLLGWRGGRYRIIWGGSPTEVPIQHLLIADLEGDGRSELLVLEGGQLPGELGTHVSVWRWHGWGFQREWQSAPGLWHSIAARDLDGDGRLEIVAWPVLPHT